MAQPDPTLETDELWLAEAIAAAARLHDRPRRWLASFGGYSTLGRGRIAGAGEYRRIVRAMTEKLKAKQVRKVSCGW